MTAADHAAEAWREGPFRWLSRGPEVMFGQVREDTSYEISTASGRVLCIASGGDLAFSCLAAGASCVTAIDVNSAQVHLVDLKRAAFRRLEYGEILALMTQDARVAYKRLRTDVAPETAQYFDSRPERLSRGLQNAGKVDDAIGRLIRVFHLFVHSKARVRRLLEIGDLTGWSSWHWRNSVRLLLNRWTLSAVFGRRFGHAAPAGYADLFRAGMEQVLAESPPELNPFVWQCFAGVYPPQTVPSWLTEEGVRKVKANLDQLDLRTGDVVEFLTESEKSSFDDVFLSNILDGTAPPYRRRLAAALSHAIKPGGRVVSRSFFPEPSGLDQKGEAGLFRQPTPAHEDRSFFCRYLEVFECRPSIA